MPCIELVVPALVVPTTDYHKEVPVIVAQT